MFDEMISEKLIEWIWILGSISVVIFGLLMMFAGGGFFGFLMAVMYVAIGLLVVRVLCESMMVAFKMHDNNRRSLAVMEQISMDQSATRKAIQAFLAQAASPGALSVSAAVSASAAPRGPEAPRIATPAPKTGWESAYASASSTKPNTEDEASKSRLGDWPGSN